MTRPRWSPSPRLGVFLSVLAVVGWLVVTHRPVIRRSAALPALVAVIEEGAAGPVYAVGIPGQGPVRLGPAPGLVSPFDPAAVWRSALYVALGAAVVRVSPGRPPTFLTSPAGRALQVYADNGRLYLLTEAGRGVAGLYVWQAGRFARLGRTPAGFFRFLPGSRHPWLLVIRPHTTELYWPGAPSLQAPVPGAESGAVAGGGLVMPDAGHERALFVIGVRSLRQIRMPRGLVLAVTGPPVWVVGTDGLFSEKRGRIGRRVAWPARPPAGVSVVGEGEGGPWVLVREQALGGVWFNRADGRFGPPVRLQWAGTGSVLGLAVWPK